MGIDYGRAKTYTVGSWLGVWMENYAKVKLRPSTFKTSQGFLKNHIKPQIGGIPLADLTSLDLQRFYKHLLNGGRVDRVEAKKKPKGLAPKTVRNIHQMIGSAYNLALEQCLVTKNPTQGCPASDSRSPSHLRDDGTPERRGRENRQQYARALLRGFHAGHLRPRYHRRAAQGGANDGEHPLLCRLMLSATRSRWGQRLGQKKVEP